MYKINSTFGRLLRAKREELKLSQAQLALELKWPQATVSRVECGARAVTLPELLALAGVFHCPAAELIAESRDHGHGYRAEQTAGGAGFAWDRTTAGSESVSPAFGAAFSDEESLLGQLAQYGIRFIGAKPAPALFRLPPDETLLAALRFAGDPRIFEALPALVLNNRDSINWGKLLAGAYALRLQNRLGMVLAAALQLCGQAGCHAADKAELKSAHDALAEARLDREEVIGPRPKTPEALAFLRERTPAWLSFWHGLGSGDLSAAGRYLVK